MCNAVFRLAIVLLSFSAIALSGDTGKKWVTGTIMDVQRHEAGAAQQSTQDQWDVSIQVGETMYVVLCTVPPGNSGIEYRKGINKNVLVGEKTMTFNDLLGRTYVMPIISSKPAPRRPKR